MATDTEALVERMEAAVAKRAEQLLSDVAISGRRDAARAAEIVRRLGSKPHLKPVWKLLARRDRREDGTAGDFHHIRREIGGRRLLPPTPDRRVAQAVDLFELACMAAVWQFETCTQEEFDAAHQRRLEAAEEMSSFSPDLRNTLMQRVEVLRAMQDQDLVVERRRTLPERKGFVIKLAAACERTFGSKMPAAVGLIARVALAWPGVNHAQVREILRPAREGLRSGEPAH